MRDEKKKFESENNVDAPESRFQTEQKTDRVAKTNTTATPKTEFDIEEVKHDGSQLKQEIAATVLAKKGGSGAPFQSEVSAASRAGLRDGSYSGDAGTFLGSTANTPMMGPDSQGRSRIDKRISDANKDINFLASEQYATEFRAIPPLSEDKSTVGQNGNPMNVAARSQRKSGFVPAEVLYDRSLDEIRQDKIIFVGGQKIVRDGDTSSDYPTKTFKWVWNDPDHHDKGGKYKAEAFENGKAPVKGNFAPREIVATFKKSGNSVYLAGFEVIEDDLSVTGCDDHVINNSSVNGKIDQNQSELARQRIDASAGSPTMPHYNPLGRSVDGTGVTQTVEYLRDIELSTGATALTALRFALKSRGYYLSRTAKDGIIDDLSPAMDALYGHLTTCKSAADIKAWVTTGDDGAISNTTGNHYGSADILLHCFDSIKKYKTKADVVNQPRGLKLPLTTGLANHAAFRYKPEFLKALNANDFFSTIDRGYDPGNTVYVTDGVRLVYPYSLRKMLKFTRSAPNAARSYESELYTYAYSAGSGSQRYLIKVADPVLNGIAWFLELHAAALYSGMNDDSGVQNQRTLHIPTIHYGCHFGLWDLLVCASMSYIEWERTNTMKDILDYETNFSYPFPELETISEDAYRSPKNYGRLSEYERLVCEQMKPEDAIRVTMPELFMPMGTGQLMLPFYFNERCFDKTSITEAKSTVPGLKLNRESAFSTPVIRSGVRLAYLDDFFGMDAKDVLLSYDMMATVPGVKTVGSEVKGVVYKYSTASDGLIVLVGAGATGMTVSDYLTTPRMMGWFMNAPAGFCRALKVSGSNAWALPGNTTWASASMRSYGCSDVARVYHAVGSEASAILSSADLLINRAQAFAQEWFEHYSAIIEPKSSDFNLILAINELFTSGAAVDTAGTFSPFVGFASETQYTALETHALMKAYWTRIQKLPTAWNPFEAAVANIYIDPLDFAYFFGLAGFIAADYEEEKYNRINEYQAQMFGFVNDPYVVASPIFR